MHTLTLACANKNLYIHKIYTFTNIYAYTDMHVYAYTFILWRLKAENVFCLF